MTAAWYWYGAWLTTVIAFACYAEDVRHGLQPRGVLANCVVIGVITAAWPVVWCVILGMVVRSALVRGA